MELKTDLADMFAGTSLWAIVMLLSFLPQIVPPGWPMNGVMFMIFPVVVIYMALWNRFNISPYVVIIAAFVTYMFSMLLFTNKKINAAWRNPRDPKNLPTAIGAYFGVLACFMFVMMVTTTFVMPMYPAPSANAAGLYNISA